MDKIGKIRRYIEQTVIPWEISRHYGCTWPELEAMLFGSQHPIEAVMLAFSYGKAKGYRAGKKGGQHYEQNEER